jgi:YVTN family beta-propeller protein
VATRTKNPTDIAVGSFPDSVSITPDGKTAFVSNRGSNGAPAPDPSKSGKVSVVDIATRTKTSDISGFEMPSASAISPDGKTVFVSDFGNDFVSTIDVATLKKDPAEIDVGTHPDSIAISDDGVVAYVANLDSGSVSTIDVATKKSDPSDIDVPAGNPAGVALTPCQATPPTTTTVAPTTTTTAKPGTVTPSATAQAVSVQPTFSG